MNKTVMAQIEAHALARFPEECCGVVLATGRKAQYVPLDNVAADPLNDFRMDPVGLANAEEAGTVTHYVHSHPNASCKPSEADRTMCELHGVPWIIVSVMSDFDVEPHVADSLTLTPNGWAAPLVGREFHHGVQDCLTLILDYYKRERGVELGSFQRQDDWWHKGEDLYRDNLPKAGFYQVNSPQEGDIVLMQMRAPVPNHAGIYLESGVLKTEPSHYPAPGSILHHYFGHLSTRDVYGGMWLEKTVSVWRLKHD